MVFRQKKNYSELFQNIQTIPDLLNYAVNNYGDLPAIQNKNKEQVWVQSYNRLQQDTACFASVLAQKGMQSHHIAIIGNLSYEWIVIFLAIVSSGNVAVPIDWQLSEKENAKLMRQADVSLLCMDASFAEKAVNLRTEFACLAGFISYGEDNGGNINGYDNIRQYLGKAVPGQEGTTSSHQGPQGLQPIKPIQTDQHLQPLQPDQSAILVFTSGTTANSKAVLLSHKNICDNLCCCAHLLEDAFAPKDCIIPVLPPHHMFEVTAGLLMPLYYGASICFGGGLKYISQNVKYFQPAAMVAVPLVIETLYKKICLEIKKKDKEKQMQRAIKISNRLRLLKIDLRSWLFREIHARFGGKMRVLICGGAFLDPSLVERFDEWGLSLRNGYGITECSPVVSCNMAKRHKIGSVGVIGPSPYCQVKITDGEIFVRGSIVMKEYYHDKEGTGEAFVDGWFKTGDLGTLDDNGYLFITGRKKNVLILADGNNISPEELEIPLEKLPIIKSVLVCIKKNQKATQQAALITACIVPDYEVAHEAGLTDTQLIQLELEREIAILNSDLPPHKRIQIIEICQEDFEKTALGKIKRYKYNADSE